MTPVISTKVFSFFGDHAACDASDLYGYDVKQSFIMKSARTGDMLLFNLDSFKPNEDGDIQYWTYKAKGYISDRGVLAHTNLPLTHVDVYND